MKTRIQFLLAGLVLAFGITGGRATTITWTNTTSGNWTNAANWSPNQVPGAGDQVIINSGAITAPANATFASMDWNGGQISGALTVATNGELNISGSAEKDLYCPLTNSGTVTWIGTGHLRVFYYPGDNFYGAIYNLAGGLFDIQSDTLLDYYQQTEVFNNAGTVRKSAGSGTTTINPQFNNTGTLAALSGTIALNGGGNLGGQYATTNGTAINLTGGSFLQAGTPVFSGVGQSQITAGALTLTSDLIPGLAMNGGTLYVSAAFQGGSITNLTLAGMSLAGTNVVTGTLNWTAAQMQGALTVASNGVLNISGSAEKDLYCPLTNSGTVTWTGAGELRVLYYPGGNYYGVIYNLAGGLFNIQNDETLGNYTGTEVFSNAGTVRKSAGSGTTTINPQFNDGGSVDVESGTLAFVSSGIIDGQFYAAAGATNAFSGSFTTGNPLLLSGPGAFQFNGGTLTLTNDVIPDLQMLGGTLLLGPAFQGGSITNLTLTGMSLAGTNVVTGTLNWTAAQMQGSLTVASNGVLNISGSAEKDLVCPLTNLGTVTWTGAGELRVLYYPGGNYYGAIYNLAGALFHIQNDQTLGNYTGTEVFSNAGTVRKSAGTGTTTISPQFNNTGTVAAWSGTIAFSGGGNLGAQYTTTSGTGINLTGGSFLQANTPVFGGGGQSQMTAGTLTLTSDLIPGLAMNGGTLYVSPTFQGGSITNLTLTGITLAGTNVVTGTLNWTTGPMQGSLTVMSNGVLNISGSAEKDLYWPLTNAGTVTWTGTGHLRVLYYPTINYYGVIYNLAGGLFDIQSDTLLDYYEHAEMFSNAGTVRKSAGSGTTTINPQFNNTGTVAALSGMIAFNGGFSTTGGELLFGMNGQASYGNISIAGNVVLGGTVGVEWLDGFVPASGNAFTVLSYGSYSGVFTNTDFPTAAIWQTNYTPTSLILTVGGLNKLAFTLGPVGGRPVGAVLAPVMVQVESSGGTPLATSGVPITLSLNTGSGTLSGTLTQDTDPTGKATFSDLSINQIGTKTLQASSPVLTTATSAAFTIVALIEVQWTNGGVMLQLNGTNSFGPIIIYASTNLMSWTPIYTNPPTTNAIQFSDASSTNLPARFYRVVEQ
jgi:hypothetical protein